MCNVASCWIYEYIGILLGAHPILHISRIRVKLERVLLNNGKVKSSIPVSQSVAKKESKEGMSGIFSVILYRKHYCQISGDLKVNETLFGLLRHSKLLMFLWLLGG